MVPEPYGRQPSGATPPSAAPDEYELVPHLQVEYLRREVEKIKRNPFGDTGSSKDLLTTMDQLNRNISRLIAIFETANDEIVRDYKDKASSEKITKVLEQNEKLAKGIVAIVDLLQELKELREPLQIRPGPVSEQKPTMPNPNSLPENQPTIGKNPFLEEQQTPPSVATASQQWPQQPQRRLPPISPLDVPPPPPR